MKTTTLAETREKGTVNYCFEIFQIMKPPLDHPTTDLISDVMKKHDVDTILLDCRDGKKSFGFSKNNTEVEDENLWRPLLNDLIDILKYHQLQYLCIKPPRPEFDYVPMHEDKPKLD